MIEVKNRETTDDNDDRFGSPGITILQPKEQSNHPKSESQIKAPSNNQTPVHRTKSAAVGAGATLLSRRKALLNQSPSPDLINESQNNDPG